MPGGKGADLASDLIVARCKELERSGERSERLVKQADSWFSVKAIIVARARLAAEGPPQMTVPSDESRMSELSPLARGEVMGMSLVEGLGEYSVAYPAIRYSPKLRRGRTCSSLAQTVVP